MQIIDRATSYSDHAAPVPAPSLSLLSHTRPCANRTAATPTATEATAMGSWGNWNWAFAALEDSSISEGYGKCPMHVITNQSRKKSGMMVAISLWRLGG